MTTDEWRELRNWVCGIWPSALAWPDASWDQWVIELDAYPLDDVKRAIGQHDNPQFAPGWRQVRDRLRAGQRHAVRQRMLHEGVDRW